MTPEQVERVMKLVERYGCESYAEGKAINFDTEVFYSHAAAGTLDEIRAALTAESEDTE